MPAKRAIKKAKKTITKQTQKALEEITNTTVNSDDIIEPDDFNQYAPPKETKVMVQTKKGSISLEEADQIDMQKQPEPVINSNEELEEVEKQKLKEHAAVPLKQYEPVLGAGEPINAIANESLTNGAINKREAAEVVLNLINGMNYLYKITKYVYGEKGLKSHDEPILKNYVKQGRNLIKSLEA
jgi:hypothetical protein